MTNCARCGDDNPTGWMTLLPEWNDHLRERQNMDPAIFDYWVPLCMDCEGKLDLLREAHLELGMHSEDQQRAIWEETLEELESLETAEFADVSPHEGPPEF